MATKQRATATSAPKVAKPERTKVRTGDVEDTVFKAIHEAGPEGITLKALEDLTGIRYRVLHNVTWHLDTKAEKIRRVGEGRTVRYASVDVKAKLAPRKRATSSRTRSTTSEAA